MHARDRSLLRTVLVAAVLMLLIGRIELAVLSIWL
jgi:hypothetical protein